MSDITFAVLIPFVLAVIATFLLLPFLEKFLAKRRAKAQAEAVHRLLARWKSGHALDLVLTRCEAVKGSDRVAIQQEKRKENNQ